MTYENSYHDASKRFIDDLADLAIERCLMSKVASLFSRNVVEDLDDAEIDELAHETANAAECRSSHSARLEDLLSGLEDLKRLNQFRKGPLRT